MTEGESAILPRPIFGRISLSPTDADDAQVALSVGRTELLLEDGLGRLSLAFLFMSHHSVILSASRGPDGDALDRIRTRSTPFTEAAIVGRSHAGRPGVLFLLLMSSSSSGFGGHDQP